jgi:NADH dehydrogenase [ubiquinone] 1 alpha subcomplex assembly factor 7
MTPLEREIRRTIQADGPMPFARYMELCLAHPLYGYYMTRDPFGVAGDFTTAPEISQMFGEVIGAWVATVWQQMGAPAHFHLVELGPGRGILMSDMLRAAKALPAFRAAASVHLVEISPVLKERQRATLANAGIPVAWHHAIEDIEDGPSIVIANEFVDALPIQQYVNLTHGLHMMMVAIDEGRLVFRISPDPALPGVEDIHAGAMLEMRFDQPVALLARRIAQQGGAALIVDYGTIEPWVGNSLQAAHHHQYAEVLEHPGEADITSYVDFARLAVTVTREGAAVQGPITQRDFLLRLGIEQRAARLKQNATLEQAADIDAAFTRLTGWGQQTRATGRSTMGDLFKVLAIADPKLGTLPGFDR